MPIQESGEMYLETILILSQQGGSVRSLDVANYMGYSKPSISRAMGILKSEGYITIDEDGFIKLTPEGSKIAKKIYERHIVISGLLKNIGVDKKTAEEDACRIEHVISDKTFRAIKKFNKGLQE
ncbi:MAG: metal-dependent transcriptional regulator [Clostridiales bacterium]|nr:metal-dependent transcriptional regulator [Clostridiales bacterium]